MKLIFSTILKGFTILTGIMFAASNPDAAQKISDLVWNGFNAIIGVVS